MSEDIERLLAEEAEASDANQDAPITAGATISRPNKERSAVYSIRLYPDEVVALRAFADAAGVPSSTLVRSWILEHTEQGEVSDAEAELRAAQLHLAHLQRHLSQHAS